MTEEASQDHAPCIGSITSGQPHTPGPWEWDLCDDGDLAFLKGRGRLVLSPENAPGAVPWVDVSEADACLIAAAPDLLANLKLAVKLLSALSLSGTAQVDAMRAAIAKAEGRNA